MSEFRWDKCISTFNKFCERNLGICTNIMIDSFCFRSILCCHSPLQEEIVAFVCSARLVGHLFTFSLPYFLVLLTQSPNEKAIISATKGKEADSFNNKELYVGEFPNHSILHQTCRQFSWSIQKIENLTCKG